MERLADQDRDTSRQRSMAAHPAGSARRRCDDGTVLAEYGLTLVVVGTIAGIFLRFLNGGAMLDLLTDVLGQARSLVGL